MPESVDLAAQVAALIQRVDGVMDEIRDQRAQLTRLARAYAVDAEQLDRIRSFADVWDGAAIGAHLREVVAAAPMLTDPLPHLGSSYCSRRTGSASGSTQCHPIRRRRVAACRAGMRIL